MMDAMQLLWQLANVRLRQDLVRMQYEELRAQVLEPVQRDLTDLEAEFAPAFDALEGERVELERRVKDAARQAGVTLKAEGVPVQAVVSKGRVSWDDKALLGFALAHPDILAFRREGEPSVSLRWGGGR